MMFYNHEFESLKLDTAQCQEREMNGTDIACRSQQLQDRSSV